MQAHGLPRRFKRVLQAHKVCGLAPHTNRCELWRVSWERLDSKLSQIACRLLTMAQAAFGRAIMASGATLLVLGGGTIAISGITMTVTKAVVDKARVSTSVLGP